MDRLLIRTIAIILLSISARGQQLTLRIDPLVPTKGTSVRFDTYPSGIVSTQVLSDLPLRSEETGNHKYILAVDTATFQRDKYHRFTFEAYLRYASGGDHGNLQKFRVVADPVGVFLDGIMTATYYVEGTSGIDTGTIRLPVHSDDGSDNISLAIPPTPQKVSFGGLSTMELGLTNNLDLPLNLADAKISSTLCERCWFLPMSAKPNLTLLNPHKSTSLMISIRPNTFTALGKSIISLNPNTAHDTVLISVASVAEQGGLVTMQEFKLPVRFAPPVLYLFSTVLAAALLGALLHRWLGLATPHKWREAGIAFVIGIVIWLAALVLFSLETRVTIFGFTLDPTQLIPAGLIAFLAAGGPPVVSKVKAAFGR